MRRRGGAWSFAAGCLLVLIAALAAMNAASPLYPRQYAMWEFFNIGATSAIRRWEAKETPAGGVTGVVFGDSVFAPLTSKQRFASSFEFALQQAGLNVKLLNLSQAGFSAYQFYYLSSRVFAAGPPDFAVVEVNLRTFSPDWYGAPGQRFSPMVVGLSTRQVWRVHQALATQQVGFLTPLTYRLDEGLGIFWLLDSVRDVGLAALDAIGARTNRVLGLHVPSATDLNRAAVAQNLKLDADRVHRWYGRDFVVSPTAEVLRAFSEDMRAAGVTMVYVVAPVQRRHLRELGVPPDDLHARTEQLREMLGASPEEWIEATELYQTSDFVDGVHVRGELIRRMAQPVVDRLVPMIAARQRAGGAAVADVEGGSASASSAH